MWVSEWKALPFLAFVASPSPFNCNGVNERAKNNHTAIACKFATKKKMFFFFHKFFFGQCRPNINFLLTFSDNPLFFFPFLYFFLSWVGKVDNLSLILGPLLLQWINHSNRQREIHPCQKKKNCYILVINLINHFVLRFQMGFGKYERTSVWTWDNLSFYRSFTSNFFWN